MAASPTLQQRYTPEDLLMLEDGSDYELVDGELVEKPVSAESTALGLFMGSQLLVLAVTPQRLGRMYGSELQVRAFPWAPNMVRKPDTAFVSAARLLPADVGMFPIAPDWVLEAVSPNDKAIEVRAKADLWLRAGVRLVWVAYPVTREIDVYRIGHPMQRFEAGDEITGEDVFPGFRARVETLFPEPLPVATTSS